MIEDVHALVTLLTTMDNATYKHITSLIYFRNVLVTKSLRYDDYFSSNETFKMTAHDLVEMAPTARTYNVYLSTLSVDYDKTKAALLRIQLTLDKLYAKTKNITTLSRT